MTSYSLFIWMELLLKEGKTLLVVLACLLIFFCLRQEIIFLLSRLNSIKYGEYELRFKMLTADIKSETIELLKGEYEGINVLPNSILENFKKLEVIAITQPNIAVLSAWRELELTAITLAAKKGVDISGQSLRRASGIASLKNAEQMGKIPFNVAKIYAKVGDSVKPISYGEVHCAPDDALTFCQNAKQLSNYLTSLL